MRDAQSEAQARVGEAFVARVLEPSPPAVTEPPWFADDPVARGDAHGTVVAPGPTGDERWEVLAGDDSELRAFCRDRWLGPYHRLEPLPDGFAATREALHAVAEQRLKPAREAANGKFGLRFTLGGFGTPFFGDHEQLRVEGHELVTTGAGGDDTREALDGVDPAAAAALAAWFGFSFSVLEELRADAADAEPSRVQLWPEHFDPALELGSEDAGQRAAYGCSPGDDTHPEPYLYVAPWTARPEGEQWNAQGFPGAELSYAELLSAADQRATALAFFTVRLRALTR